MSDTFLSHLTKSQLLSQSEMETVTGLGVQEPKALAQSLVERGTLTHWQVEQLLAGRHALLFGKYKLLDKLGEGGMGAVYKAQQKTTGRVVALKVMSEHVVKQPGALSRFQREIRAASALDHPNIVAALDADQVGENHFLVMEYAEGSDLKAWIKEHGRLPIDWACECIRQAALGLQHAHERGLAHRDIKPSNMLVVKGSAGEIPQIKILDMGLARFTSEAQCTVLTQTGQCLGTIDYIAPEQAKDTKGAGIRADIFSLGASLFHLITGEVPYQGRNPMEKLMARAMRDAPRASSLRPEVTAELDAVVARMLARDPEKRYQTPIEVARALGPYCLGGAEPDETISDPSGAFTSGPGSTIEAHADSTSPFEVAAPRTERSYAPRTAQPVYQNPAAIAAGVVVLALVGIGLVYAMGRSPAEPLASKSGKRDPADLKNPPPKLEFPVTKEPEKREAPPPPPSGVNEVDLPKKFEGKPGGGFGKMSVGKPAPAFPVPTLARVIPHDKGILSAAITADGKRAVSAGYDQPARLWDLDRGAEIRKFEGPTENTWSVALSPDEKYVAGGSGGTGMGNVGKDNTIRLWNTETGQEIRRFGGQHPQGVMSLAFSPNGKMLASVINGRIQLWDVEDGTQIRTFDKPTKAVKNVVFSRDGKNILSGETDANQENTMWMWDTETGKAVLPFKGHKNIHWNVSWSPVNDYALSSSRDSTLRLWNPTSGEELRKFGEQGDELYHGTFTPDGRHVLGGTAKGGLRLYDIESGRELIRCEGHKSWITALAISANGRRAVSGGQDKSLIVWDLTGGAGATQTIETSPVETDEGWKKAIDLLALADPVADRISGAWKRGEKGCLISDNSKWAKLEFPYYPPEEYDYRIRYVRRDGKDTIAMMLARGERTWVLESGGWFNTVHGFGLVNGHTNGHPKNPACVKGGLENFRTYTSLVEVRKTGIKAYIDGSLIAEHATDFQDLSSDPMWKLRSPVLGIGSGANTTVFFSAHVREISGRGKVRERTKFEMKTAPAKLERDR